MTRFRLLLAAALVTLASALPAFGATTPVLRGETGPGFSIEVEQAGKDVKRLKRGTYMLRVQDKSAMHNFRLRGPGLNRQVTSLGFVGTKTIKVTLRKGTYTYQCDPHAAGGMKGTFKVS